MTTLSGGRRVPARKLAALLGVVGLVLMSTGLSLVVQGSAVAETTKIHKSYVCKYVGKPGQSERLQTGQNPIWVDNDSLPGSVKGALAYVGEVFADAQGKSIVIVANTPRLNPEPTVADCPDVVTPSVQFTDSTCANGSPSSPSWQGADTAQITYTLTSGTVTDGASATITATPKTGFAFPAQADDVFTHTFGPTASNCSQVPPPPPPPPTVVTPGVSFIDSTCSGAVATDPSWTGVDVADIEYAVTAGAVTDGSPVTITATPKSGFAFAPDATSTFSHTFAAVPDCGSAGSTVVTPGVSFADSVCRGGVATTPSWTGADVADIGYAVTSGAVADGSPVTITATPRTGFSLAPSATPTFSHTFGPAPTCGSGVHAIAVTSSAAEFQNPACPEDAVAANLGGSGFLSSAQWQAKGDAIDAENITYTITGSFSPGGIVDVTATADPGYVLTEGSASHWTHTFSGTLACSAGTPIVVPTAIDSGLETVPGSPVGSSARLDRGLDLIGVGAVFAVGALIIGRRQKA